MGFQPVTVCHGFGVLDKAVSSIKDTADSTNSIQVSRAASARGPITTRLQIEKNGHAEVGSFNRVGNAPRVMKSQTKVF
jgi:hypothetical protein